METNTNEKFDYNRRNFIESGVKIAIAGGIANIGFLSGCKTDEEEGQKVSPPEDLMQEHGVLNRVLLIYDNFLELLANKKEVNPGLLLDAAIIIRKFIEDYHEKQEEQFLFPRFEKAGKLIDLVQTLRTQHQQGGIITSNILQIAKRPKLLTDEANELTIFLSSFVKMYRPHEAREDTVLFPAFRTIVSKNEYDSLGEDFEKNEYQMFGEGGFQQFVDKVAYIEKELGIFELAQFTPTS
ncbi:hemerythrin-like domain-containing protein [Pedobacter sp. CG_S7]|uniref:hemerythrin domain-containing protein n=1 Tax=Pedobacter sp. CG_S7 TaxID=3143930 RepID=UPI00339187F0